MIITHTERHTDSHTHTHTHTQTHTNTHAHIHTHNIPDQYKDHTLADEPLHLEYAYQMEDVCLQSEIFVKKIC